MTAISRCGNGRLPLSTLAIGLLLTGCGELEDATSAGRPVATYIHPVFGTVVSDVSPVRPVVLVELLDASESYFGDAVLYLTVQSSRFPDQTRLLLPLNRGQKLRHPRYNSPPGNYPAAPTG